MTNSVEPIRLSITYLYACEYCLRVPPVTSIAYEAISMISKATKRLKRSPVMNEKFTPMISRCVSGCSHPRSLRSSGVPIAKSRHPSAVTAAAQTSMPESASRAIVMP